MTFFDRSELAVDSLGMELVVEQGFGDSIPIFLKSHFSVAQTGSSN
jgi:hypothetical protein